MCLFIKLDNIKLNIKDKENNPTFTSNLEYRGITKVDKDGNYTRRQLYYPNNNITTDYRGTDLINYIDGFKIDTNILNIDKTSYKNKLKNLLNKNDVTDNYYYDVIGTHLRINLTKGLPIVKDIDLTNTDINFDIKNFGVFYTKQFDVDNLHIPIDKDNLNGDICKMVDYELDFFIDNKSKYDVSTCCLEITTGGNKIWLKPQDLKNNIYHFKENIRNFLRLEELNDFLEEDKIKLLIYYNGRLGKEITLENIDSINLASSNTNYLFNEEYKIYNVVTNKDGIKEYTELKTEPGKIFVSDINLFNIIILSKDLQDNIMYKNRLHNTYIKLNQGEKYLEFSIINKISNSIKHERLKIYNSSVILQNKPTKLRNILDKIIYNLSYKDLYKYYNNEQVKDNIKQLGNQEIKHLVKLYKHKKYEKLVNYLNEYKDTEKFPLIYNSLLLKLTVQEQLEFGKIFQVYTSKQQECKNNKLPNQLPYDSRKIEVETVSMKQEKFRNMIENDTNNKTLYVEYGTFRDYDKINKIIKNTPSDKIKYRLVIIPLVLNNTYSLSYDSSKNKNLYSLPKYLERNENLNTSSVNVVMKELIKTL